jgi:hypothetical protein
MDVEGSTPTDEHALQKLGVAKPPSGEAWGLRMSTLRASMPSASSDLAFAYWLRSSSGTTAGAAAVAAADGGDSAGSAPEASTDAAWPSEAAADAVAADAPLLLLTGCAYCTLFALVYHHVWIHESCA